MISITKNCIPCDEKRSIALHITPVDALFLSELLIVVYTFLDAGAILSKITNSIKLLKNTAAMYINIDDKNEYKDKK